MLLSILYYNTKSLISTNQHGFMTESSTSSNVACFTQYVSEVIDVRGQVDTIYTDLSRAFHSINHGLLLKKVTFYGASPKVILLLQSYLTDRINFVHYKGFRSCSFVPTSGVPE